MGIVQETVIVVPCYNEARRLDLDAFRTALAAEPRLRFVFVDDGSKDDTAAMLENFAAEQPNRVFVVVLEKNSGKAEAVRQGVLRAGALGPELIGYWDADLATPLGVISQLAHVLENSQILLVMGSRVRLLGRRIDRTAARHYIGRAFATVAAGVLGLAVYDTQCGAKLFRANALMLGIFERRFELNWCFDVEILARLLGLEAQGLCNVKRQCVEFALDAWIDAPGSKLSARQFPRVFGELVRLAAIARAERQRRG